MWFKNHPWFFLAIHGVVSAALYSIAAHAPLGDPVVIGPGAVDGWIPFQPWAAWLYATYLLVLPAVVFAAGTLPGFWRVLLAGVSAALANALVYLAWPTKLDVRTDAPAGTLLALIQRLDTTWCALPSGHVSLPMAIAVASFLAASQTRDATRQRWHRLSVCFFLWTIVLAASTLLTRQHYAVDAAAGAVFGAIVARACWAISLRSAAPADRRPATRGLRPITPQ